MNNSDGITKNITKHNNGYFVRQLTEYLTILLKTRDFHRFYYINKRRGKEKKKRTKVN